MAAVCADWVTPRLVRREVPDRDLAQLYDRLYPSYRAGYRQCAEFWDGLLAARQQSAPIKESVS
jgi:sugar (pentulose or hexulose) kinase